MRLAFGNCIFDRDTRELTRNGVPVHGGPKLLALLEVLIDARPRVLTKDEIHRALWPGTFVSDATLSSLVAELRAAVGDDARASRLVRTVHGFGYAFCADAVEPGGDVRLQPSGRCHRLILGDREIVLSEGETVLGRSNDVEVFLDDAEVSRRHARITIDSDGATLEDLGSKNGTILNGLAIEGPAPLTDGALVVVGSTAVKFRTFDAPNTTETRARAEPPSTEN